MKHRRKIWSIPIAALALVLMLVGALAVSGIVQAFGDAPKMGTQIDDQNIRIGAAVDSSGQVNNPNVNVTINLADVDAATGDQPAFTDVGTADGATTADPLAYTVLTYNYKVAFVELPVGSVNTDILTAWWDSLGAGVDAQDAPLPDTDCSKRAARLGFTAGGPLTEEQITALPTGTTPNPHRAARAARGDGSGDDNAAIPAVGLCADYADADGASAAVHTMDDADTDVVETLSGAAAIEQAFHWDMLSGAEMAAAAASAGFSGNYAKTFADLTPGQRVNVERLYQEFNVLARGAGILTLDNLGIDSDSTNDDLPGVTDPPTTDGEPGTTKITVKVSDDTGRLIPPGNGSDTVGQSFDITASLTPTDIIGPFETNAEQIAPAVGEDPAGTYVTATGASGSTGVVYVPVETARTPDSAPHRYEPDDRHRHRGH